MNVSKEQGNILKGLAISMIMVHNFVYKLLGIHCNEMSFNQQLTENFCNGLFSSQSIWYILSYAGWIGVPLFFFLSGYGLTKKYNGTSHPFDTISYFKKHVIKLLKLLVPIYALYVFFDSFIFHNPNNLKSVLAHVTFTINLFHYGEQGTFHLRPEVYWFFGAILQFYILFIFIRKFNIKMLCVLALVFLGIHYSILYFASQDTMDWCRHNFIGWGLPFVLGMIAAKSTWSLPKRWTLVMGLVSLVLLSASLVVKPLSPLVDPSTITLFLIISNKCEAKWIYWIGAISASIFVIHPFIRLLYFNTFCSSNHPLLMTIIYIIPVILLSWLHHEVLAKWTNKSGPKVRSIS